MMKKHIIEAAWFLAVQFLLFIWMGASVWIMADS